MKIAIGSDHLGFRYKEMIKKYFEETGHLVRDFGTFSDDPVDYPVFIHPVAEAVSKGEFDRGVVVGGSGNGAAITVNDRYKRTVRKTGAGFNDWSTVA